MGRLHLRQLDAIQQIRAVAPAWDRLWQRSQLSSPMFRAEMVAQWLEHFAARAPLRVLLVEQDGELAAAMPLVGRKVRCVLPVGDLTTNCWSPNGELVLDPQADTQAVLDVLVGGLRGLPWPLLWLDVVPVDAPRWQALAAAVRRQRLSVQLHARYEIGQVEINGSFEQYEARWSKNHRRNVRKDLRRLEQDGPVQFSIHRQFTPSQVNDLVGRAFQLEDHSWKGAAGYSVRRWPGMFEFFLRQARQLAEWGCLRLAFLEHRGRPIAFEYGWTAKGVYYSYKVGYDPSYAQYSPGHLLRLHLIRALHEEPGLVLVDFHGPMTEALACWTTRCYRIGRLIIAPRRPGSRLLLAGLTALRPLARRLGW